MSSVAGAAPSGANLQPWHFVAIIDPKVKREIRVAAEAEEIEFYKHRAPKAWLEALAPLGTDWHKPFLETAPWLIAIFAHVGHSAKGARSKHLAQVDRGDQLVCIGKDRAPDRIRELFSQLLDAICL